jgi:hypothetical protein
MNTNNNNDQTEVYINIVLSIKDFNLQFQEAMVSEGVTGLTPWVELKEQLSEIINIIDNPRFPELASTLAISVAGKVEHYGLSAEVIALLENGYSIEDISTQVSRSVGVVITPLEIEEFIERFNKSNRSTMTSMRKGSIWNTQGVYEELYQQLTLLMEYINLMDPDEFTRARITKPQVLIELFREMRQTAKEAANILAIMDANNKVDQFIQIALEQVRTKVPNVTYREIIQAWSDQLLLLNG